MLTEIEMAPLYAALHESRLAVGRDRWDIADILGVVSEYFHSNPDVQAVPPVVFCSDAAHQQDQVALEGAERLIGQVRQSVLEMKRIIDSAPNLAALSCALDALRELVRLHRLKADMDMRQAHGPMNEPGEPTWASKAADYEANKPKAWAAAYSAIDAIDLP